MQTKCIEIRDHGTCIPAVAFKMTADTPAEDRFFWLCGYPRDGSGVILMELNNQRASSDPYEWGGRTYPAAHNYICSHFDEIPDGGVVDVRVILGEAEESAPAEICVA